MRAALRLLIWLALLGGVVALGDGLWLRGKAMVAQSLLERAWAAGRSDMAPHKPWPWADIVPVARLSVPGRKIAMIVLEGVSGQALAFGPGRHPALARPGMPGPMLLAGHRDTHFRFLSRLEIGEAIAIETATGERLDYRVAERVRIRGERIHLTATGPGTLILSTCLPASAGDPERRLVVVAERSSV